MMIRIDTHYVISNNLPIALYCSYLIINIKNTSKMEIVWCYTYILSLCVASFLLHFELRISYWKYLLNEIFSWNKYRIRESYTYVIPITTIMSHEKTLSILVIFWANELIFSDCSPLIYYLLFHEFDKYSSYSYCVEILNLIIYIHYMYKIELDTYYF